MHVCMYEYDRVLHDIVYIYVCVYTCVCVYVEQLLNVNKKYNLY